MSTKGQNACGAKGQELSTIALHRIQNKGGSPGWEEAFKTACFEGGDKNDPPKFEEYVTFTNEKLAVTASYHHLLAGRHKQLIEVLNLLPKGGGVRAYTQPICELDNKDVQEIRGIIQKYGTSILGAANIIEFEQPDKKEFKVYEYSEKKTEFHWSVAYKVLQFLINKKGYPTDTKILLLWAHLANYSCLYPLEFFGAIKLSNK